MQTMNLDTALAYLVESKFTFMKLMLDISYQGNILLHDMMKGTFTHSVVNATALNMGDSMNTA